MLVALADVQAPSTPPQTPRRPTFGWACFTVYLALVVTYLAFARGLNNGAAIPTIHPQLARASTQRLVEGTAYRPFSYRVLVPSVLGAGLAALGADTVAKLDADLGGDQGRMGLPGKAYHQANTLHAMALLLWTACLTGFAWAMRAVFVRMHPGEPVLANVGPMLCLAALPAFGAINFYVYDAATPLVFGVALALAWSRRWVLFWLLLPLAALHKETALALPILYAAFAVQDRRWKPVVAEALVQVLLIAGVLLAIRWRFAGNPGAPLEVHLASNLYALTHPKLLTIATVALVIGVAITTWRRLPHVDPRLARAVRCLLPLALLAYVTTSMLLEIRSLLELWPLLAAVLLPPLLVRDPAPSGYAAGA